MLATRTRHAFDITGKLGVTREGRITAISLEAFSNSGAYASHGHSIASAGGAKCPSLYPRAAFEFAASTVYTNLPVAGAMRGIIATDTDDLSKLMEEVQAFPGLNGIDLVQHVTCRKPYRWLQGPQPAKESPTWSSNRSGFRVAAMDYGIKYNILRLLERAGCQVMVFPAHTSAARILAADPDGVFLSNGPGDPAALHQVIGTVRELLGKRPMFGICLGHQLMGLALGGKTFKLKFGHRGANQPVKDLTTEKVEITSQNHGYCVDIDSLSHVPVRLTHLNLNDNTLEGMEHLEIPAFSVQYHPEASPGPHDASYLFDRFIELMKQNR
ncbi:MAG: glutamine-hydrolyzing carbamoyl-phosphate synthase small subunit, partial [Syntrophobacteraceae bacterium]|nr:glutamine-hydrolyzing carbamoyl-phosphate synthase small subunit [Syntrophobacteraceae bacterium]